MTNRKWKVLAHEITGGGSVPWRRRSKPDEVDAEVSKPQQNVRESFGLESETPAPCPLEVKESLLKSHSSPPLKEPETGPSLCPIQTWSERQTTQSQFNEVSQEQHSRATVNSAKVVSFLEEPSTQAHTNSEHSCWRLEQSHREQVLETDTHDNAIEGGLTLDGEVLFAPASFLQLPLQSSPYLSPYATTSVPPNQTYSYRGNYRRFLTFLCFGLFLLSPIVYLVFQSLGFTFPVQAMLLTLTGVWLTASAVFYWTSYGKRYISVDHFGLHYQDELRTLYVTWSDIKAIHLHAVEAFFNPYPLCYVRVITESEHEIAFANFGPHLFGIQRKVSFGNPAYPIIDIRDADLLLALLVQQVAPHKPTPNLERLRYRAIQEMEGDADEELNDILKPKKREQSASKQWVGIWTIFGKSTLQWLPKTIQFLLKTIKPGYVGVSVGLYAVFFQWQFAVVLGLLLLGHELGHVWAMYRHGMRIRGVYLIPFFGAATVTEDTWPSWNSLARVSLAGPLWGTYLTGICFILYILFPNPFWLMATVLGALLNLLNLLPVQPLDGGRILHAIAYSLRSSAGLAVTLTILGATILLSLSMELLLLYILSVIGVAEFFREYMYQQRANKLALLHHKSAFSGRDLLLLKSITGINFGLNSFPQAIEREKTLLKRLRMLLHAPTMSTSEMLHVGLTTVAVAAILFGFLVLIAIINPTTQWALKLFQ